MFPLLAAVGGSECTAAVIVLLLVGAWVIIRQAGHNRVDFSNVNDADSVVVAKQHDPELGRAPKTFNEVKKEFVGTAATTSTSAATTATTTSVPLRKETVA